MESNVYEICKEFVFKDVKRDGGVALYYLQPSNRANLLARWLEDSNYMFGGLECNFQTAVRKRHILAAMNCSGFILEFGWYAWKTIFSAF